MLIVGKMQKPCFSRHSVSLGKLARLISWADAHSPVVHQMRDQGITMEPLSNPVGAPLKASSPRDLLLLEPADDDVSGEGPSRALPDVTVRKDRVQQGGKKGTAQIMVSFTYWQSMVSAKMVSVTSAQYNSLSDFLKFIKFTLCFYENGSSVIFIFAMAP